MPCASSPPATPDREVRLDALFLAFSPNGSYFAVAVNPVEVGVGLLYLFAAPSLSAAFGNRSWSSNGGGGGSDGADDQGSSSGSGPFSLVRQRVAHDDVVTDAEFSLSGELIVTAAEDLVIKVRSGSTSPISSRFISSLLVSLAPLPRSCLLSESESERERARARARVGAHERKIESERESESQSQRERQRA
jgi:hypothetical protein